MPVLDRNDRTHSAPAVRFTGPWRYIVWMALFTAAVAAISLFLIEPLGAAFRANPAINGLILAVLVIGVLYTYAQALGIGPAARWLVRFRSSEDPSSLPRPPALIAPMAGSRCRPARCAPCSTRSGPACRKPAPSPAISAVC